jgi:[methyl-Co(III) methanol-specific corrinoid protein]:coenzyme M methyltransferase
MMIMINMSQKERLVSALMNKPVDKTPVVSVTQTGTLELMNAANAYWPAAHRDAKLMADLALAAHTIAGLEAVRLPFGLTGEAASMGCRVNYHEDKNDFTPTVECGFPSYDNLPVPSPNEGLMGTIMDAVGLCRERVGCDVPIIVGVTGPFTLAGHIRGVNDILTDVILDPDLVNKILETTWRISANFAGALVKKGVDVIAFIEPTASIIGPDFFKAYALPYLKKAAASIRAPTVLHICGDSLPIMEMMVETGVSGISIDQKVSAIAAKSAIRGRCSLVGNIDPVAVLQMKGDQGVEEECIRLLSEGVSVLAPGCGISPYTRTSQIAAMVKARDKYFEHRI